jgi:hypothetical protein
LTANNVGSSDSKADVGNASMSWLPAYANLSQKEAIVDRRLRVARASRCPSKFA